MNTRLRHQTAQSCCRFANVLAFETNPLATEGRRDSGSSPRCPKRPLGRAGVATGGPRVAGRGAGETVRAMQFRCGHRVKNGTQDFVIKPRETVTTTTETTTTETSTTDTTSTETTTPDATVKTTRNRPLRRLRPRRPLRRLRGRPPLRRPAPRRPPLRRSGQWCVFGEMLHFA